MSQLRLPPPPPTCLVGAYASSQKGGTLVAEYVSSLAEHRQRICVPGGYRPSQCAKCLGSRLHVHDYRERKLRAESEAAVARVVRYLCCTCGAIWLVLPRFIARRLWRTWRVVEVHTLGPAPLPNDPPVPERTQRRWRGRLACAARHAVQVIATSGAAALEQLAGKLGLNATRADLVLAYAGAFNVASTQRLAGLAAHLHRLAPGARLM